MAELPGPLRGMLRAIRHGPDRLLHPRRRRSAVSLLREVELPARILLVCHGNVCRSAYAVHALSRRLPAPAAIHLTLDSAGFIGPGRPCPSEAVRVAARRDVDLTGHRSRLVTLETLLSSSVVLVMEARQRDALVSEYGKDPTQIWVLGDLDPEPVSRRGIEDPFGKGEKVFERVFQQIDRTLEILLEALPLGAVASGPQPWGGSTGIPASTPSPSGVRPWNSRVSGPGT